MLTEVISKALARSIQLQIDKFWIDSAIEMSIFENSYKSWHQDFSLDKKSIRAAQILAQMTRKAFFVSVISL